MRALSAATRGSIAQKRLLSFRYQPRHSFEQSHVRLKSCTSVSHHKSVFGKRRYYESRPKVAALAEALAPIPTRDYPLISNVTVPIDGTAHEFSPILLRDLCQCPVCVHESTNQKLYSTADVPSNIEARSVNSSTLTSDAVGITWNQDVPGFDPSHTTTLTLDALRSVTESGATPSPFQVSFPPPVSWENTTNQLPDFGYDSYMQDDSTLLDAIQQLHSHGLVFITGVPGIEKSVSTIAERIGPVKDTFYGHTWDVRTVPQAINAAYTSNDLGFHTDLLYFQNPPHIQLLHCIHSSSAGGASVFADAFRAAVDLYETDINAFNILATTPVTYHYKHPDANLYTATKPVFDMRPLRIGETTYNTLSEFLDAWDQNRLSMIHHSPSTTNSNSSKTIPPTLTVFDCLDKINWGPPFLAPFSLQPEELMQLTPSTPPSSLLSTKITTWHAAAQKFSTLLHRPTTLHERLLKPGECVLFNNTRVLHSRRAFEAGDVGKQRWLRGTYVDKDPFLSRLRVLSQPEP